MVDSSSKGAILSKEAIRSRVDTAVGTAVGTRPKGTASLGMAVATLSKDTRHRDTEAGILRKDMVGIRSSSRKGSAMVSGQLVGRRSD